MAEMLVFAWSKKTAELMACVTAMDGGNTGFAGAKTSEPTSSFAASMVSPNG